MKVFEKPMVEVIKFTVEDILTTSEDLPPLGGNVGDSCAG